MREETELNIELTARQSEIEAAMSSMEPAPSAIDQNVLMYQAGWSAAMAEVNDSTNANLAPRKSGFSAWPAIAATFAASTVACLALLLTGPDEGSGTESETMQVVNVEAEIESSREPTPIADDVLTETAQPISTSSAQFGLAKLFGISADQIVGQRDAQIKKLLAETASPPRDVITMDDDKDWEPRIPLTLRSPNLFSL